MARSDLLLSLVRAGTSGDLALFRKTVEALIAEERAKRHEVFASQLASQLARNGSAPRSQAAPINASVQDLFFELVPKKTEADLILSDSVRTEFHELVEEHNRCELLRSYNLQPRNRVLLVGPPGNGKTSLAEALAHALSVPFIVARYEGLIGSYLGETASRLRRLFDYIRSRNCMLFFDEFDTLGKERGDLHETGEIKRVVSSLLLQIDDLPSHVIVVTATNHPELLDRAVWRRFQLRLSLNPPDRQQTEQFFARFSKDAGFALGVSPSTLASRMKGVSFSELHDFVSDVARAYVLELPRADPKNIIERCLERRDQPPAQRKPK
jgi:SpoVK/Ycf46/Vps4 family AAA+-type ATPase